MRIFRYIFAASALLLASCEARQAEEPVGGVSIELFRHNFAGTRVIDEDNPASEQVIKKLAVMFTDPSSDTFTHKYLNSGFTTLEDYRIVTIPLDPAELQSKDIYVVTNYEDIDLSAVNTVTALRELFTPEADKTNNLTAERGFCMYGKTAAFDFTAGTNAIVTVVRTCAKFRISLGFPENVELSTDNTFLMAHAAEYTYVADDVNGLVLTSDDYFNFASPLPLVRTGNRYVNTVYMYEAPQPPLMYLYTHINGSSEEQEFIATLPLPVRNYMYDLVVYVYEEEETATSVTRGDISGIEGKGKYHIRTDVTVYDEQGRQADRYSIEGSR